MLATLAYRLLMFLPNPVESYVLPAMLVIIIQQLKSSYFLLTSSSPSLPLVKEL